MIDFARACRTMVDTQVRPSDVTDTRLLDALLDTPREAFVDVKDRDLAYLDMDIRLGTSEPPRYLMQAMVFAKMVQVAGPGPTDSVLDVGCATGYSAAVLARLCRRLVALESDDALRLSAERNLRSFEDVTVVAGPLQEGWARSGPYDVILLEGGVEVVPHALTEQLNEGGRLVAVVGSGRSAQATVYVRSRGDVSGRRAFDAATASLPGFAKPPVFAF